MLGIVMGDLFLRSSRIHPTLLSQRERLLCMTYHDIFLRSSRINLGYSSSLKELNRAKI
jgi:hypothetical protein